MSDPKQWDITELLQQLVRRTPPHLHQQAWGEFLARYRALIETAISRRCQAWNSRALDLQRRDVVDDVFSSVMAGLVDGDFSALKSFRGGSEGEFRSWLNVVAKRAAGRFLRSRSFERYIGGDDEGGQSDLPDYLLKDYLADLDEHTKTELYEHIVAIIRREKSGRRGNAERDLHIFLLYTLADFDQEMIASLPVFCGEGREIGHRVVDNVVNRLRTILREKWESDDA